MVTYDSLRRQCRTLESLLENKLNVYSRLASTISSRTDDVEANGSSDRWQDLESEVDGLLEKLQETNEQLSATLNDPASPPSQSMMRAVQLHRDVLQDYMRETVRTKANVKRALDEANLLSGVRNDIEAYKSSAAESLLAERGRIDNSHSMTDSILDQARATRAEFAEQRGALAGINTRMSGVISTIPGINNLLSMIKSRRRRDSLIIGCLIGVCTLVILSYLSR